MQACKQLTVLYTAVFCFRTTQHTTVMQSFYFIIHIIHIYSFSMNFMSDQYCCQNLTNFVMDSDNQATNVEAMQNYTNTQYSKLFLVQYNTFFLDKINKTYEFFGQCEWFCLIKSKLLFIIYLKIIVFIYKLNVKNCRKSETSA